MTDEERHNIIMRAAEESAQLRLKAAEGLAAMAVDIADRISGVLGAGGKILICGNGGSAADSSHMAAEMIVRLTSEKNRAALAAICLNSDISVMTAAANDYGFDSIYARQVAALGRPGDVLLAISTSGNSANVIKAAETARQMNLLVIGLLGGNGGRLAAICDKKLIIPHKSVQRIQEEHIFYIHLLVELIESDLF